MKTLFHKFSTLVFFSIFTFFTCITSYSRDCTVPGDPDYPCGPDPGDSPDGNVPAIPFDDYLLPILLIAGIILAFFVIKRINKNKFSH